MTAAVSSLTTTPPGGEKLVMLFDGHCRFCTQSAKKLARWFPGSVKATSFQDDGVLDRFPGVSYDACMKRMHVVTPDGRVYAGAAAVSRILRQIPVLGLAFWLYYLPGLRQLAELAYELVAKYRYKLFGKSVACDPGGTCHLHG